MTDSVYNHEKKQGFSTSQKFLLAASIILTQMSFISLVLGSTIPSQSTLFEIVLNIYKGMVHVPADLLLAWIGITIPAWGKDAVILLVFGLSALNLLTMRKTGKSFWSSLAEDRDFSLNGPPSDFSIAFTRTALMFYALILMTFAPINLLWKYRKSKKLGETENWEPIIECADAYFRQFSLAVLFLIINYVLFKIGL